MCKERGTFQFPNNTPPGPSVRSGDFSEILVADYIQFLLNYNVPRTRYDRKATPNSSTQGTDILGFKFSTDNISDNDELITCEVKGSLRLARRDGTFTLVPKEYWDERERLDITQTYKTYTDRNKTVIVKATQDEVVSNDEFSNIFKDIDTVDVEADHDFTKNAREELVALCNKLIL